MSKTDRKFSQPDPKINPQLREKLLKETKNPFYGPRRILWVIFFAAASLGLLIMFSRLIAGENVLISDFGVQGGAFLLFGLLIWFDRRKDN
tara:strand:- start:2438 stop:2710 length:273 start_codon:yes stop_codon:yes gene_type:complete